MNRWSKCSVKCGEGEITRFRTCTNPPPSLKGRRCQGEKRQARRCFLAKCKGDNNNNTDDEFNAGNEAASVVPKTASQPGTNQQVILRNDLAVAAGYCSEKAPFVRGFLGPFGTRLHVEEEAGKSPIRVRIGGVAYYRYLPVKVKARNNKPKSQMCIPYYTRCEVGSVLNNRTNDRYWRLSCGSDGTLDFGPEIPNCLPLSHCVGPSSLDSGTVMARPRRDAPVNAKVTAICKSDITKRIKGSCFPDGKVQRRLLFVQ